MKIIIFLILGFVTSLLFPPYFILPLGFVVFPILCYLVETKLKHESRLSIFLSLFAFGFSFFLNLLFWLQNPFFIFEETQKYFYFSILIIIFLSLIFGILFFSILYLRKMIPIIFLVPLIFTTIEFTISNIFYGFPWISFSLIISSQDYLLFSLKHFGTFITSYIVIKIFCLPYLFLTYKFNLLSLNYLIYFIFVPLLMVLTTHFLLIKYDDSTNEKIAIEIFQLNFKQDINKKNLKNNLEIIKNRISQSNANILVFAENNYPYAKKDFNFSIIQEILKEDQIVIIGGTRIEDQKFYNSLFHINKSDVQYFDKIKLVPFGEFLPLRKYLSFLSPISGSNDFSQGIKDRLIYLDDKKSYIPIICYEIIFYWKIMNNLNFNSNFIVNITNDIWFGKYLGPYQHFYLTKLRAAEFNKPIIRVSNNGISGVINENGKIINFLNLNETGSSNFTFSIKSNINYYQTHYYLKIYILMLFILLFIVGLRNKNDNN